MAFYGIIRNISLCAVACHFMECDPKVTQNFGQAKNAVVTTPSPASTCRGGLPCSCRAGRELHPLRRIDSEAKSLVEQ